MLEWFSARSRVCSLSHLTTTAEVLLRVDSYEAVEAVVCGLHSGLGAVFASSSLTPPGICPTSSNLNYLLKVRVNRGALKLQNDFFATRTTLGF
jgi:hypothetical protein